MPSSINSTSSSPGGIVTTGAVDNALSIQTGDTTAVSIDSSQVVTFNNPIVVGTNAINAENSLGFRNRIINGDMRIDQRNAGASVTLGAVNPQFTLDRWCFQTAQASKISTQQNQGSVTPPIGFTNYLGVTSLSAYSVLATDFFNVQQRIEGYNFADLGWGTADAKTVTFSFWVRSSLTGIFGGSLSNTTFNRSYPFSYTISSANTWEYKTVTIPGSTSGTWGTTNGIAIYVSFGLGMGSNYSGTAGSWTNAGLLSCTGATSVVGTNGATFYITGVQLEVGSVATPFERRPYGTELMLCQRYYCKTFDISVAPGNNVAGAGELLATNINQATYEPGAIWRFPVAMRSAPTVTMFNPGAGTAGQWYDGTNSSANARAFNPGTSGVWFDNSGSAIGGSRYRIQAVASIEL